MAGNHSSYNPNHTIEWPKCWSTGYTGLSLIGWNSENSEDRRMQDLTHATIVAYDTMVAYEELTQLENHNGHN